MERDELELACRELAFELVDLRALMLAGKRRKTRLERAPSLDSRRAEGSDLGECSVELIPLDRAVIELGKLGEDPLPFAGE